MLIEKKAVSGILLRLLLVSVFVLAFNIQPVKASGTIYIRADGSIDPPTAPIQRDGDIYTLTGNITSDAYGIVIERNNMALDGAGYTVQGTGVLYSRGIDLSGRSNVTIKNMNIKAFYYGIFLSLSSNNSLSGNNMTNSCDGIFLYLSSKNSLSGNNMTNNAVGIWIESSSKNSLSGNTITNNSYDCIYLHSASNNSLSGNNITNNVGSTVLEYSSNYNSLSGNTMANNSAGIDLYSSSKNSLSGNTITNNSYVGIGLISSSNYNSIVGNNITNNGAGIGLEFSSNYNSLSGNTITNSSYDGINIYSSSNYNSIVGNNITNNAPGIGLWSSSNNIIYHNNFVNNTQQVYIPSSGYANVWDDGYPSGGNYWSNYTGADLFSGPYQNVTGSDGIGDTPHILDANNQDRYPLMNLIKRAGDFGTISGGYYSFDGRCDYQDAYLFRKAYAEKYHVLCDFNNDLVVNYKDLFEFRKCYLAP